VLSGPTEKESSWRVRGTPSENGSACPAHPGRPVVHLDSGEITEVPMPTGPRAGGKCEPFSANAGIGEEVIPATKGLRKSCTASRSWPCVAQPRRIPEVFCAVDSAAVLRLRPGIPPRRHRETPACAIGRPGAQDDLMRRSNPPAVLPTGSRAKATGSRLRRSLVPSLNVRK